MTATFEIIIKFIIAIVGFGILITVHELGHFIVAVLFKIKVEKFSIGIGPAIFSFKKGDTKYQIGAIPLGGFCQFKGDELKDDLPSEIKYDIYNQISDNIKKQNEKEFLNANYYFSIPDELKKDDFELIKNKSGINQDLLSNYYIYNDEANLYAVNSNIENANDYLKLIEIIRNIKIELLIYKIKDNLDKITKKSLYKIISKNISVYKLRDPDSFFGAKPYKRLFVAVAGSFMNYLIAIIFLTGIGMLTHKESNISNKILLSDDLNFNDYVYTDKVSPAKTAGLETGDVILSIDDKLTRSLSDIVNIVYNSKKELSVKIYRNGNVLTKSVKPVYNDESLKYVIGILPYITPVIKNNNDSKLQYELELNDKDLILGIDRYKNVNYYFLLRYIWYYFGTNKTSILYFQRDNKIYEKNIVFNDLNKRLSKDKDIDLDIYYDEKTVYGKNIDEAFLSSFDLSFDIVKKTFVVFYNLIFKPKKNVQNLLGGPISAGAFFSEQTVSGFKDNFTQGIYEFFFWISLISLSLSIFNLLPIPALDGGHVVMTGYEIITRKAIKLKIVYIINIIFFMILMGVGLLLAFHDVFYKILGIFK